MAVWPKLSGGRQNSANNACVVYLNRVDHEDTVWEQTV